MTETPSNPVVDELDVHNGEPKRPTFLDANGVERIAGPPVDDWKPAQVDPTPEQVAANEAYHVHEAARRDEATALLSGPTSEPLAAAQQAYHSELDAAGSVTPADPVADPVSTPVDSQTNSTEEVQP